MEDKINFPIIRPVIFSEERKNNERKTQSDDKARIIYQTKKKANINKRQSQPEEKESKKKEKMKREIKKINIP